LTQNDADANWIKRSSLLKTQKSSGHPEVRDYAATVERLAPNLIDRRITVRVIDEEDHKYEGCGAFIARHEDALFLGPPGTGKSHLAQAIRQAAIQQGCRVLDRETHTLLDNDATLEGNRKGHM
jgi:replication-associated recombination protein RarA